LDLYDRHVGLTNIMVILKKKKCMEDVHIGDLFAYSKKKMYGFVICVVCLFCFSIIAFPYEQPSVRKFPYMGATSKLLTY
jgi:hypothetical protein